MRKGLIPAACIVVLLILVACNSAESEVAPEAKARLGEGYPEALPVEVQLAFGSLHLEETELAIDETLAASILPLWQAYQALSSSDTTAEAELTGVINQIQDAMSPEQIEAIAAMDLTDEDITSFFEEQGPGAFGRFRGNQGNNGDGGPGGFPGGPGGFPGGGPGGGAFPGGGPGGGFAGGFGNLSEDDIATRQAQFEEGGLGTFRDRALTNALIVQLQLKTGELNEEELQNRFNQAGRFNNITLDVVSETTGIAVETLSAEIAGGATLAEVITANGGDLEEVEAALAEALDELPRQEGQDVSELISNLLDRSLAAPAAGEGE